MPRKIIIDKYQGSTVYSVHVTDSYGRGHHLGYWKHFDYLEDIEKKAEEIWANEVKPKEDLLCDAVAECVKIDIDRGVEPSLD